MRSLIALTCLVLLAGCQSIPTLSSDQLNAIPNGSAFCAEYVGMGGTGKITVIKLDQGVIASGNIIVDANTCGVTLVSNPAVVAAAQAAAAAARAVRQ